MTNGNYSFGVRYAIVFASTQLTLTRSRKYPIDPKAYLGHCIFILRRTIFSETGGSLKQVLLRYNTDRQTDNWTRTTDLLATDSKVRYCAYNNAIRLVHTHVMSIFRHGFFAVIKLCTKRLKYKTTPCAFNLHHMRSLTLLIPPFTMSIKNPASAMPSEG